MIILAYEKSGISGQAGASAGNWEPVLGTNDLCSCNNISLPSLVEELQRFKAGALAIGIARQTTRYSAPPPTMRLGQKLPRTIPSFSLPLSLSFFLSGCADSLKAAEYRSEVYNVACRICSPCSNLWFSVHDSMTSANAPCCSAFWYSFVFFFN